MNKTQKINRRRRFRHFFNTSKKCNNQKSGNGTHERRREATKKLCNSKRRRRTVRNKKNRGGTIVESLRRLGRGIIDCVGPLCRNNDAVVAPVVVNSDQQAVQHQIGEREESLRTEEDDIYNDYNDLDHIVLDTDDPVSKLDIIDTRFKSIREELLNNRIVESYINTLITRDTTIYVNENYVQLRYSAGYINRIEIAAFFANIILQMHYKHNILFRVIIMDYFDNIERIFSGKKCLLYNIYTGRHILVNYDVRLNHVDIKPVCLLIQKYDLDQRQGYKDMLEAEADDIVRVLQDNLLQILFCIITINPVNYESIYVANSMYNNISAFISYWNGIPNGIGNEIWGLDENFNKDVFTIIINHEFNGNINITKIYELLLTEQAKYIRDLNETRPQGQGEQTAAEEIQQRFVNLQKRRRSLTKTVVVP